MTVTDWLTGPEGTEQESVKVVAPVIVGLPLPEAALEEKMPEGLERTVQEFAVILVADHVRVVVLSFLTFEGEAVMVSDGCSTLTMTAAEEFPPGERQVTL